MKYINLTGKIDWSPVLYPETPAAPKNILLPTILIQKICILVPDQWFPKFQAPEIRAWLFPDPQTGKIEWQFHLDSAIALLIDYYTWKCYFSGIITRICNDIWALRNLRKVYYSGVNRCMILNEQDGDQSSCFTVKLLKATEWEIKGY